MLSEDRLGQLRDAICKQVGSVLGSRRFQEWAEREKVPLGDLIVFNNSFLHRGNTSKSKLYLCGAARSEHRAGDPAG
jgi:hypothetical protein